MWCKREKLKQLRSNLVCFVIAYNFNGKFAPEAGKARMRTAFFTRVHS